MAHATAEQVAAYRRDGAVYLPGLFKDWVGTIGAGIERNMREPGPYASENLKPGEAGASSTTTATGSASRNSSTSSVSRPPRKRRQS